MFRQYLVASLIGMAAVGAACATIGGPKPVATIDPGDVCLPYDAPVALTGTIQRVKASGPPQYASPNSGKDETHYELFLAAPICTIGDEGAPPERMVTRLQIFSIKGDDVKLPTPGKPVQMTGELMHSYTLHHHTDVLLGVR